MMPAGSTYEQYKFSLLLNTCIPALCGSFCLYMSGNDYVAKMTLVRKERADALAKAMQVPEIAQRISNHESVGALAF